MIAITWRPAYALAAAAAFTAAAAGLVPMANRLLVRPEPQVFTEFVIQAPTASNVALAGDFSGWKPAYAMTRSATGVWTVVVPLAPGVHDYSFVIDGQRWVPDPAAPAVKDGFGGVNSRRAVLPPDGRTT
ncbi:MAG TPA: glycogen-binding domain-containing protein [Gemmatimonadaceae bacterium]|nr:glycogen-binding domain-containing protein [Gemmatimonadaceae bacterium]